MITVEYDIREDQPEGTEVFELEPSSIDLIEKLAKHRFPHLSPVDLRTIAEFSGGNARIAIALAGTIDGRKRSRECQMRTFSGVCFNSATNRTSPF